MSKELIPPCSYQGGKQRLSSQIIDIIDKKSSLNNSVFIDFCCGSGAISLELINNGFDSSKVYMVDKGCFGGFYQAISNNTFDLNIFKNELKLLPEKEEIQKYLQELSNKIADKDLWIYHYLILQAGAFGSKQIWLNELNEWKNNSFRSLWKPTETSNRKSIVNPMMPMPDALYDRVERLVLDLSNKIHAYHQDIMSDSVENILKELSNSIGRNKIIIYIDPPYLDTTGYQYNLNIYDCINKFSNYCSCIYVSEGKRLDNATEIIVLDSGRKKGNITGKVTKEPVEELLHIFRRI